jgi:hypothetical protein
MILVKKSFSPGTRVKGSWVNGEELEPEPFEGTAQPASGETLRALPEGERKSDVIEVIAPREMTFTVADVDTRRKGDIIVWMEKEYEVIGAALWDNLIPHWELVARRPKEGQA